GQGREGVQGGGDVVEGVRPPAREVLAGRVPAPAAPVLHAGHGEAPTGQEGRERADVPPVVGLPPGPAVQDGDQGGRAAGTGRRARRVEVDHLVGAVAVGRARVRVDGRVGQGRLLLGGGPGGCGGVR